MRQILAADYEQIHLLPASVEDWVGPEHPARFVREFVGALDLKGLGLDTLKRDEGGATYEPGRALAFSGQAPRGPAGAVSAERQSSF